MTATRRRNPRGTGSRLREEILAAATELLDADGGERAVTLRAVARKAGIAAPSIYSHYLDQPAIIYDVARQAFTELCRALRTAVDQAGADPDARLDAACTAYLNFATDHPMRYRTMFGTAWNSVAAAKDSAELGEEAVTMLAECLADCVRQGHCSSADPATDAVALWLGLHGLAHQRSLSHSYRWPGDIVQRITSPLSHLV
ncbi:TetR/AcrR family transcriptional regulator [Nocardia callitridis]|uniref:TetR/AcrR family transcriptional regulator n=1 Tax=Nocardia callitridis TaxID=648753 RepID=A0ABP9JXT8_9NOCA